MNKLTNKYTVKFFNVYQWGTQSICIEAETEDSAWKIAHELELGELVSVEETTTTDTFTAVLAEGLESEEQ